MVTRLESGALPLQPSTVQLEAVVKDAVTVVQPLADAKGLELIVKLDDAPTISADAGRIAQILINLLSNAVKFTDRGGVKVEVHGDDEWIITDVSDTGKGIAQ